MEIMYYRGENDTVKNKENGYDDAFQEQENGRHISFKFPQRFLRIAM